MAKTVTIKIQKLDIDFTIDMDKLIYFPFIGWMYPFAFNKDDSFSMHHATQAFFMAAIFAIFPTLLTFLSVFIPNAARIAKLICVIIIYLNHLIYFSLCVFGFIMIMKQRRAEIPVIAGIVKRFDIWSQTG